MIKISLAVAVLLFGICLEVIRADSVQISRSVPGNVTLHVVSGAGRADVDRSGKVDHRDLLAISKKFQSRPAAGSSEGPDEDVNQDGVIDVLDLAAIGRFFDLKVAP